MQLLLWIVPFQKFILIYLQYHVGTGTVIITVRVNNFSSSGDDNESGPENEDQHHLQLDIKVADPTPDEDYTAPGEDDGAPGEDGTAPGEPKDEDQVKEEELESEEEDAAETLPR